MADGFEIWNPPAPGVGRNSAKEGELSILKGSFARETRSGPPLTVVHLKPRCPITAIPTRQSMPEHRLSGPIRILDFPMLFVYEQSCDRPRPGIHVLVSTPSSEIDVPVVQIQRHITRRMGEVPADEEILGMCVLGDPSYVEQLSAVVLDPWQEDQGEFVSMLVDRGENSLRRNDMIIIRFNQDHRLLGIKPMPRHLRLDRVLSSRQKWSANHQKGPLTPNNTCNHRREAELT